MASDSPSFRSRRVYLSRIIELLKVKGAADIVVFGGGIIPEGDFPALIQLGVKVIFSPGTAIGKAVTWVRENIKPRK